MKTLSTTLEIEKKGNIAILWLNRAKKYNALSSELWGGIPDALNKILLDDDINAIILAGRGKHFCVGIDLAEAGFAAGNQNDGSFSEAESNLRQLDGTQRFQTAISSIAECELPVIGVIHGYCLGAGVDLITACDIRICSADANFSVRETKIGIVADVGTLQRLPKILNAGHVAELVYTGKDISAQRAEKIGLVNDVFESFDAAFDAAYGVASEIAYNSTLAVRGTKFMLRQSENLTTDQSLLLNGMFTLMTSLKSNDLKESMRAFFEKRPPKYTGT